MAKSKNSILFATVPFTLGNKIRRYVPALCELDVKQGRGKGGRGEAKSAEARKGERERKRHATVADIQRILKRTAPK